MNRHDLEVRACSIRVEIEWIEKNEKKKKKEFVCCLVKKKGNKTFWMEPKYFSTGPKQNLSLHIREKTSIKSLLRLVTSLLFLLLSYKPTLLLFFFFILFFFPCHSCVIYNIIYYILYVKFL